MKFRSRSPLLCLLATLAVAGARDAGALQIHEITGVFSNTVGGSGKTYPLDIPIAGWGTELEDQARWGTPATPAGKSGLGFTPNVPDLIVFTETEFVIGRMRHFNNPITRPATETTLTITLDIAAASPNTTSFPYVFTVDETDNLEPCVQPGETICPDRIDNTSSHSGVTFFIGPFEYTLSVLGWREETPDGPFSNLFVSEEGGVSTAFLVGKITSNLVPEPGTGLLLGSGLVALSALRRRSVSRHP